MSESSSSTDKRSQTAPVSESIDVDNGEDATLEFQPIRTASQSSGVLPSEPEQISRIVSRRLSSISSESYQDEDKTDIQRLVSNMFGRKRQESSEEEQTRHLGVVWKNLTVKGVGLGAALQPTNGDFFLWLPRFIKGLVKRDARGMGAGKQPVRTILHNFTVGDVSLLEERWYILTVMRGLCATGRNDAASREAGFRLLDVSESDWQPEGWIREHRGRRIVWRCRPQDHGRKVPLRR